MRRSILLLGFAVLLSRAVSAQVSTVPTKVLDKPPIDIGRDTKVLDDLTVLYNGGNWSKLRKEATSLLESTAKAVDPPPVPTDPPTRPKYSDEERKKIKEAVDTTRHYVIVTWIGTDAFGKRFLPRIVVHNKTTKKETAPRTPPAVSSNTAGKDDDEDDDSVEPFPTDLPGVGVDDDEAVYEVFFSRGTRGRIAEVYASTRDKDPFVEQLPAFIQAIAAPLFNVVGVLRGSVRTRPDVERRATPDETIAATVARVGLPFERATIKWKAMAKEPVTLEAFTKSLADAAVALKFTDVPNSACGKELVDKDVEVLGTAVGGVQCRGDDEKATADCTKAIDEALKKAYDEKKEKCGGGAPTKDDIADLDAVDKKIRAFVTANLTATAEADVTFKNRPDTHFSLGAGSGVITHATLTLPRVVVDKEEKLAADPMPRVLTLAFVNWNPWGYDSESDRITWQERTRLFFGATLTPDFGVTAGGNILLVRGVGIIAGSALTFAKGANKDQIGKAPAEPEKPYTISYGQVKLFVGISYNFKS